MLKQELLFKIYRLIYEMAHEKDVSHESKEGLNFLPGS